MGKIYRVLVIEQDDDNNSRPEWGTAMPHQRTLFEAAGLAERLIGYASDEVYAALRAVAADPQRVVQAAVNVAGEVLVIATTNEADGSTAMEITRPDTEPAPKPRKRRTKAEIEADKAREAAAAEPSPENEAAIAEAATQTIPGVTMTTTFAGAAQLAPPPSEPPAPPAPAWNPFAQVS
jgi:hypothetical protein